MTHKIMDAPKGSRDFTKSLRTNTKWSGADVFARLLKTFARSDRCEAAFDVCHQRSTGL